MLKLRSVLLPGTLFLCVLSACGGGTGPSGSSLLAGGAQSGAPVTSTPAGSSANATVYDNVQQLTGWLTCGACGNTGGAGALANYQMTRGITSPSLSGSSTQFSIGGTYAYANAYWYYRHQPRDTDIKSLTYEFDLYVPSGSENAPQAIEFECQQRLDGYVYNFAWQAEYPMSHWRVFNYTARRWEDSGILLQRFTPGSWHHVVAEYHNDALSHTTHHDALTVDGVRHAVNIVHSATSVSNQNNEFTNAFQLDLNGSVTPYSVYVDRMRVTLR